MAGKDNGERIPLPPYISYKTFFGFIQKLKQTATPERIDASLLRTYSGSVARHIMAALKYLGLIDDAGQTTDRLRALVKTFGTSEWQEQLIVTVSDAYRDVINGLKLDTATPGQLAERFKARGAEGGVQQKCIAFFIAAATNAGMKLSPHIVNRPRAKPDRSRPKKRSRTEENPGDEGFPDSGPSISPSGTVRFSLPIPGKPSVALVLPADLELDDWTMVDAMVKAYVQRRSKA
jgi:hypothetical protein